jgi:hypothetical protein
MKARTALLELFKESHEWRNFFRSCSETGALSLCSQACQFRDELTERGHRLQAEEVEDALLGLARELLPESQAARWDAEWAHGMCKGALARLGKRYVVFPMAKEEVLDFSAQDVWDGRMDAAASANDPASFRAALIAWERAGLEAMEQARIRGGAA